MVQFWSGVGVGIVGAITAVRAQRHARLRR